MSSCFSPCVKSILKVSSVTGFEAQVISYQLMMTNTLQFYMIFVSFFGCFYGEYLRKMPQGWGFSIFFQVRGCRGFTLSFCPGGGEFTHQKKCMWFDRGDVPAWN